MVTGICNPSKCSVLLLWKQIRLGLYIYLILHQFMFILRASKIRRGSHIFLDLILSLWLFYFTTLLMIFYLEIMFHMLLIGAKKLGWLLTYLVLNVVWFLTFLIHPFLTVTVKWRCQNCSYIYLLYECML